MAIADAKYWQRPLSQQRAGDARDAWQNSNPSFQIVNYLVATRVDWGILTNGRTWRLYSRQVSGTATEFYEVDLVDILEFQPPGGLEALDRFKRWWLFFRRAAFVPDTQGRNFLERVRDGSATYARVVGDQLKDRVFDQIFPLLAGGFVADMAWHGLDTSSEATRRQVYEATLSLLYKLLFLLYGEARGLLPIDHRGYRGKSLTQMTQEIARLLARQEPLGDTATDFYSRLLALFELIDRGDRALGLPRYNGGLFHFDFRDAGNREKQAANFFLTQHKINDQRLAQALDLLARVDGEAVDYAYIGVRHLGAIYEGLLEYRLIVDDAAAGRVHLENDKGERKATGSYYTPDYIVKYIVRHTLAPILEERAQRFAGQMEQIAKLRHQLRDPRQMSYVKTLRPQLDQLEQQARETVLDVKTCDPAMGSGHFLVEVVDFMTTSLIHLLNQYPEDNPVLAWLERIRQEIMQTLAAQGIAVDPERLDDIQLLQRVVMKRCIYGVDLNRMAVELAKVSLWLHTFTIGAPLSFLDHHLRWGNSLIGAMAQAAAEEMAEISGNTSQMAFSFMSGPFAGLLQAADVMREISVLSDATLDEVERSEALFSHFDRQATPYKRLLDVYVARHFGVKRADEFLRLYGVDALKTDPAKLAEPYQKALAEARQLYEAHRFFHWDLEFPEVFIDLARADWKANGGFDAVVGNPPYVRQEELRPLKPYFKVAFDSYHGVADLYLYFYEQGIKLLQEGGRMAYISSGTFARANFARPFRRWLPQHAQIESLIDFGENQPFPGAEMVRPSIVVLSKEQHKADFPALFIEGASIPSSLDEAINEKGFDCAANTLLRAEWTFQPAVQTRLFEKLLAKGKPLEEVVNGQIHYGVKTGFNEAFLIDRALRDKLLAADPNSAELLKPILRGADLRPWYQKDEGRWLIFTRRGLEIDEFPAVRRYLEQFRTRLEPQPDGWDGKGRWPGRKPGPYQWYEIQDTVAYYKEFEKPKIFWPDIAKLPRFSWDDTGQFVNDKGYIIAANEPHILAILQSRVLWFAVSQICVPLRLRAGLWQYQMKAQFITRLPIPEVADDEKAKLSTLAMSITEQARARYKLHEKTHHRILTDLGSPDSKLNIKLTQWWRLKFPAFRNEIKKVFKRDIPLNERDEWEAWFNERRARHRQYTAEIVRLETELNERVYALFDLTAEEIKIIEESTRYRYGEV